MHEQSSGNHHHHHQQQLPRFGARAGAGAATGVSRPSKKSKVNKAPQRGLGVAQLEKLRMEEQKKMEGAATAMSVSGAAHLGGAGGGLGHLLPMHPPPPPPPLSLSALPRPGADGGGVHCGYPPVLWDPSSADPMKNLYKRSLCSQPSLPSVRVPLLLFFRVQTAMAMRAVYLSELIDEASVAWAGEHGLVADGVVEPPNGAPFKPNVQQQQQQRLQEQRGGAGAGRRREGTRFP